MLRFRDKEGNMFLSKTPSSILSYLAFLVSCTVIAVLCELNRYPWNQNLMLQNITCAAFCIISASLYIVYMILTALLKFVLTYAESLYPSYHSSEYDSASFESDDDVMSDEDTDDDVEIYHLKKQSFVSEETEEEQPRQRKTFSKKLFNDFISYYHNALRGKRMQEYSRRYRLPRSIIISSMYLGGSGSFLAILPLCMWDFTMSSSFIFSMIFISCLDSQRHACEFKPNIDKAKTLTVLKWLRRGYHFAAFVATTVIMWLDSEEELVYYVMPSFYSNSLEYSMLRNSTDQKLVLGGHSGLQFKWPLVILSASSPMFLRASGGGVGNFFFSLPPSQTLETGLPVSTILAILVLFWHSPDEKLIYEIESMINVKTAIPLFVLCPLCICAALAFILYGFKKRASGVIAVVLLMILCIRQQITSSHKLTTHMDFMSLASTANAVIAVCVYLAYKYRVMLPEERTHTWCKKPLIVKERNMSEASVCTQVISENIDIENTTPEVIE